MLFNKIVKRIKKNINKKTKKELSVTNGLDLLVVVRML